MQKKSEKESMSGVRAMKQKGEISYPVHVTEERRDDSRKGAGGSSPSIQRNDGKRDCRADVLVTKRQRFKYIDKS
jgi:hypothetical protein